MNCKKFFGIFVKSLKDIVRNPKLILPGIFLWILLFFLSMIGRIIAPSLQSNAANISWVILFSILNLAIGGFVFAGLIGMAKKGDKGSLKDFVKNSKQFWFGNFLILILFVVLYNVINLLLYAYTKIILALPFEISVKMFQAIAFLIGFCWIAGIFLFFMFSNFYLVIENLKIKKAIGKSFSLVKKEYVSTLLTGIIFFILFYVINLIPESSASIIKIVFVMPFLGVVLTRFVLENK